MRHKLNNTINRMRVRYIIRQMKRTGKRMDDRDLELKMLEEGLERMKKQMEAIKE